MFIPVCLGNALLRQTKLTQFSINKNQSPIISFIFCCTKDQNKLAKEISFLVYNVERNIFLLYKAQKRPGKSLLVIFIKRTKVLTPFFLEQVYFLPFFTLYLNPNLAFTKKKKNNKKTIIIFIFFCKNNASTFLEKVKIKA